MRYFRHFFLLLRKYIFNLKTSVKDIKVNFEKMLTVVNIKSDQIKFDHKQ